MSANFNRTYKFEIVQIPKTQNEIYEFRVLVTKAIVEQHLCEQESCWYPQTDAVSFTHGLFSNFPNHFQMKILPELKGIEIYHSKNLISSCTKDYQPKISRIELKIRCNEVAQTEVTFREKELNELIISPTGHQYDYCHDLDSVTLARKWSNLANEFRVVIHVRKEIKPEVLQYQIPKFNYMPVGNKKQKVFDRAKYFLSTAISDVSIQCEAETFPAHIFVLSVNSPVFAKMFEHDLKESKEKVVEIKDSNPQALRELLRYFYCGQVENFEDVSTSLYELADRYMVDKLKDLCVDFFMESVNKENALEMYILGKMKEIQNLVAKAEPFVIGNKSELIKTNADLQGLLNALAPALAEDVFKLLVHT